MISEFFISCFFGLSAGFFERMPDITWTVDTSAWTYFGDFLSMVAYLLPFDTVKMVAILIIDITIARIVISALRTIMGLIPFV